MESPISQSRLTSKNRMVLLIVLCITVTAVFVLSLNVENRSGLDVEDKTTEPEVGGHSGDAENLSFVNQYMSFAESESGPYFPEVSTKKTGSSAVPTNQEDDYLLYPLSQEYALPKGYAPSGLVSLSSYDIPRINNQSFNLRSDSAVALEKLSKAFEAEGYKWVVRSAYRSEGTQSTTFNSWVQKEQAKGYSYSEAVARASRYSARPRHSEHQLGTAVDLVLPRLNNAFTQNMWGTPELNWLSQNAHKYGFVISYPQNRESITGYTAEPWHFRYIGEEYATALYDQGYLNPTSPLCLLTYLLSL